MHRPREHGPAVLSSFAAGWGRAAIRAGVALAGAGALAVGLVFLVWFASDPPRPSVIETARAGGSLLLLFHRVPFSFDLPGAAFGLAPGEALPAVTGSVAVAPLTGTALVLVLLARGGAAVARAAGGSAVARGLHGAKVAVPYAVVTLVLSFAAGFDSAVAGQAGPALEPSPIGALVWPLMLGVLAGFGGGLSAVPAGDEPAGAWSRRLRAALAGGWRMLWLGLALSFLGVLVLASVESDATRAYLRTVAEAGVLGGAALVGLTLLVVPNIAAWVLYPAMGGCVGVTGAEGGCVISFGAFPDGLGAGGPVGLLPGVTTSEPSTGYFLFALAPLLAVLWGGAMAARRARAETGAEGAAVGAMAGVVFGLLSLPATLLAQITFGIDAGPAADPILTGTIAIGPYTLLGGLVALAWGIVGGAVGGFLRARSGAPAVDEPTGELSSGVPPAVAPPSS
jgi:Family of unknown function (DUF6350)